MGGKRKSYTEKQKIEAIEMYKRIGSSRKTSKAIGVPARTILGWVKDFDTEKVEDAVVVSDDGQLEVRRLKPTKEELIAQHDISFTEKALEFEEEALSALAHMVNRARNSKQPQQYLRETAGALKIVRETLRPNLKHPNVQVNTQVNNFNQFVEDAKNEYK